MILDGRALRRSDAAIAVLAALPRWGWVTALGHVPRAVRDRVYTFIARNRYSLFGRHDTCDFGGASLIGRIIVDL